MWNWKQTKDFVFFTTFIVWERKALSILILRKQEKKGHDFKDYICPDTMEFEKDYFKMGNRYGRVLFLREYASYIKEQYGSGTYGYEPKSDDVH